MGVVRWRRSPSAEPDVGGDRCLRRAWRARARRRRAGARPRPWSVTGWTGVRRKPFAATTSRDRGGQAVSAAVRVPLGDPGGHVHRAAEDIAVARDQRAGSPPPRGPTAARHRAAPQHRGRLHGAGRRSKRMSTPSPSSLTTRPPCRRPTSPSARRAQGHRRGHLVAALLRQPGEAGQVDEGDGRRDLGRCSGRTRPREDPLALDDAVARRSPGSGGAPRATHDTPRPDAQGAPTAGARDRTAPLPGAPRAPPPVASAPPRRRCPAPRPPPAGALAEHPHGAQRQVGLAGRATTSRDPADRRPRRRPSRRDVGVGLGDPEGREQRASIGAHRPSEAANSA